MYFNLFYINIHNAFCNNKIDCHNYCTHVGTQVNEEYICTQTETTRRDTKHKRMFTKVYQRFVC